LTAPTRLSSPKPVSLTKQAKNNAPGQKPGAFLFSPIDREFKTGNLTDLQECPLIEQKGLTIAF
jgi:hypothetical protein